MLTDKGGWILTYNWAAKQKALNDVILESYFDDYGEPYEIVYSKSLCTIIGSSFNEEEPSRLTLGMSDVKWRRN
jgi:hypothetical protein